MNLDTFLTELYVFVDDWYKAEGAELLKRHAGAAVQMSDSEVLTLAIVGQWRVGVPWQSERGMGRYFQAHGRQWFPTLLQRSALNERIRLLWSGLVRLQQVLGEQLETAQTLYECVDCVPLPACSLAQAEREAGHWLWWSSIGYGGNHGGWFFGEPVMVAVSQASAVTGWLIGPANADDRWMLQVLVSGRAGCPERSAPLPRIGKGEKALSAPVGQILPLVSVGQARGRPYLADGGFKGARWRNHWRQDGAEVITIPPKNAPDAWSQTDQHWLRRHRQIVETVFSRLGDVFGLFRLQAHSRWGQLTRLAAKFAAYNFGVWLNSRYDRPLGALATLLC
jgi:hypothetical protein